MDTCLLWLLFWCPSGVTHHYTLLVAFPTARGSTHLYSHVVPCPSSAAITPLVLCRVSAHVIEHRERPKTTLLIKFDPVVMMRQAQLERNQQSCPWKLMMKMVINETLMFRCAVPRMVRWTGSSCGALAGLDLLKYLGAASATEAIMHDPSSVPLLEVTLLGHTVPLLKVTLL
eukprot:990382-Pelagomonas_calceolata.AAC.4